MSVADRLEQIQAQLDSLREEAAAEAEVETGTPPSTDPAVQEAGVALAQAVAESLGIEMPLQVAEGSSLPVIELPAEFAAQGGIGVAVMVARPPQG